MCNGLAIAAGAVIHVECEGIGLSVGAYCHCSMAKQHLCPSNYRCGFGQFCTVVFGGAFFDSFYCVPCALSDTLGLRCTKFIFCVKAALLAKRAFVVCFASWYIVLVPRPPHVHPPPVSIPPPPRGGTVTWPMNNKKSIGNHRRRRRRRKFLVGLY